MPDLSLSRQEMMGRHLLKQQNSISPRGVEFHHDNQKLTVSNSLFQAVVKGNINKVRHLLGRGANLNTKNDYGFSPLVAAMHIEDDQKRARMFKMLLDKGASYKARDETYDRTILCWACILGQFDQAKTLLEHTAGDINLLDKDNEGFTALHHAVRVGSFAIADMLVNYHVRFGVTVDAVDNMGLTPYLHARRLGYKDVASVLRAKGQASAGHGDNLFRSPREWSQIGKFERKKAIELQTQDQVNAAKVLGKLNLARYIENSPRMAIPNIVVPSYRPDPNNPQTSKKPPHHLSISLPALGDAAVDEPPGARPSSTGKNITAIAECNENGGAPPGRPVAAFVEEQGTDSKSSMNGNHRFSTHDGNSIANNSASQSSVITKGSLTNQSIARSIVSHSQSIGSHRHVDFGPSNGVGQVGGSRPVRTHFGPPVKTNSNLAALSLLEQTSFSKGKIASQFHHSEFDKTKASEYKNMMGNLNSIMDILSQQQTKSFRKSVEVKKPETPPKVKKKAKVSTWAILFGDKKSGRRRRGRSPAGSSAKGKGGKDAGGKGKKSSAKSGGKGGDSSSKSGSKTHAADKADKTPKKGMMNKLPVPTIKIN